MTERTRETDWCPRPTPFAEARSAEVEYERVVTGLATELGRLEDVHAPATGRRTIEHRGRPLWWWRWQVVTWVFSAETERAYGGDGLRGFRAFLKSLSDEELARFLESIERPDHDSPSTSVWRED